MATVKFRDISPFTKSKPLPPEEDYRYAEYLKDLAIDCDRPSLTKEKLNLAIFGMGRAGILHLASVLSHRGVTLLYIVDDNERDWDNIKKYWDLQNVTFLTSKQSDEVFQDHTINAIIVASPTETHKDIVTKALNAGKQVFCEKPIASDRIDTSKCFNLAEQKKKTLFCAFNRRFDPSFSSLRDRVHKGEIGHVHVIKSVARDSPLPSAEYLKTSGGIFDDCAIHDIDMIIWILGEYPKKVFAFAHAHIPEIKSMADFDTVVINLFFPSGTMGIIDISRHSSYGYDQRLEVFGPKGMLQVNNEQPNSIVSMQSDLKGPNSAPIWYSFASRYKNSYRREFNHFIDIINNRVSSSVLPKEVLAACKIVAACKESMIFGKLVTILWEHHELPKLSKEKDDY